MIRKSIEGEVKYFGQYNSLDEARYYRKLLEEYNWNEKIIPYKIRKHLGENRYIFKKKDRKGRLFYGIVKRNTHKQEFFGTYKTLSLARRERDLLEQNDWDWENVCSQ